MLTLVLVFVPPLIAPHSSCLVDAGLLPTEAAYLMKLGTMLELLSPKRKPVLTMGDLNAYTAALAPTVEG